MKRSHLSVTTALSTGILLSMAAPAMAQDAGEPQATEDAGIGDIIVTARRSEERLQDVPISITVLDNETLSKRNIVNTTDLGAYVPSLSVNQQFGPEKASFVIRGFAQAYHTAPTVGVYFADVIAPRANGPVTGGNGAGVGSMFDLENLQVLKGPQGTLFGRNTTGGAILLVPTKPKDELGGYIEGTYGRFDQRRVEAVLNVPLSDTFRIRAGVDWNKRDGYLKNYSGVGPDRYRDRDYIAARLSVVADLTPDLENYTIFSYSKSETNGDVPVLSVCDRTNSDNFLAEAAQFNFSHLLSWIGCGELDRLADKGFWSVESDLPNPKQNLEQWQIINTTTWQASDSLTIKNIASYSEYKEYANWNLWGTNFIIPPGTPLAGIVFPPEGSLYVTGINLHQGVKGPSTAQWTFTEELQFQGEALEGRLNWQAGAYIEISKPLGWNSQLVDIFATCSNVETATCLNPTGQGQISDDSTKDYFNDKGLYAQATYELSDQFSITGGFRYTWDKQTDIAQRLNTIDLALLQGNPPTPYSWTPFSVCQPTIDPTTGNLIVGVIPSDPSDCDVTRTIKSSKPTWTIDLQYRPTGDIMLYAKWSRGYRMGAITSNSIGFEEVGPEKVDMYEIGAKTSFRGAVPGYFNIAGFYNDFRDQQLTVNTTVAPAFTQFIPPAAPNINAGKSRMWGIEADASVRPFEGFKLDVAYTYLNTKLQSFTPPAPVPYYDSVIPATDVGGPLPLSPKNRVTVSGTYTLPLDESIGDISFGATFVHTDKNQGASPLTTPAYLVKASDLLNLNVDWKSVMGSPIDMAFYMTNVTNEKLILYPSSGFRTVTVDGGHVNEPRMWGVRVKYRFGQ